MSYHFNTRELVVIISMVTEKIEQQSTIEMPKIGNWSWRTAIKIYTS